MKVKAQNFNSVVLTFGFYAFGCLLSTGCASRVETVPGPQSSLEPQAQNSPSKSSTPTDGETASTVSPIQSTPPVQQISADQNSFYVNSEGSPLVSLLKSAKSEVQIEIYEMGDPQILLALHDALTRGVRIEVVQEPNPLGAQCAIFGSPLPKEAAGCANQRALVAEVNSRGGKYVPFNKAELCGTQKGQSRCFEHGKIVIVDQQIALLSTGNFNATNLCDLTAKPAVCNRDYSVAIRDPDSVAALEEIFSKDLAGVRYDLPSILNSNVESKLTVSPYSLAPIVEFISKAKSTIEVQNQYLEEPTINAALIKAATRGVKVEVTVASACSFTPPTPAAQDALKAIYTAFDQAGISSRFFTKKVLVNGKAGYLHAKAIVVDHALAWVGSVNGSTMSASENREYGVYLSDSASVSKLESVMLADHANPGTETWQESLNCSKDK